MIDSIAQRKISDAHNSTIFVIKNFFFNTLFFAYAIKLNHIVGSITGNNYSNFCHQYLILK